METGNLCSFGSILRFFIVPEVVQSYLIFFFFLILVLLWYNHLLNFSLCRLYMLRMLVCFWWWDSSTSFIMELPYRVFISSFSLPPTFLNGKKNNIMLLRWEPTSDLCLTAYLLKIFCVKLLSNLNQDILILSVKIWKDRAPTFHSRNTSPNVFWEVTY